jgi:uncharacterized protein GlcG (DUF336 family)
MSLACRVAWRPLRGIARCAGERQRPHHHWLIRRFAFVRFALACTSAVPASAALIMHRDLSLSVARSIAEEAVAACAAKTYAVSAVVVGRDGETIVEMRGDETAPHTMENARRKAYSAMTFRQPTAEYAKKLQDPNSVAHQQATLPNVIATTEDMRQLSGVTSASETSARNCRPACRA